MKIAKIEITTVEVPIRPFEKGGIAPYLGSQDKVGTTKARSTIFKVFTDEGIIGWGEMNPFVSHKFMETLLEEYIEPKVIGMDPFNIRELIEKFRPIYNPQFNTVAVLSGLEMACWDIIGKTLGQPLYKLLGGKIRNKIEISYCFGILGVEETKDKVFQLKEEGYKTIKTKGGGNVNLDIKRTKAIREVAGEELELRIDINQGYDVLEALRYLKEVEEYNLQYIEQPIKTNKIEDLKYLRKRTKTPIAINEDCYIPNNLYKAVKNNAIDVAVVDFEPLGGISELLRIESLAEEVKLPLAHHCGWDMGVKLAAILHLNSALPAFTYAMDSTYFAHEEDVITDKIQIIDGYYLPPEGPGLGVEVDEKKLKYLDIKNS